MKNMTLSDSSKFIIYILLFEYKKVDETEEK